MDLSYARFSIKESSMRESFSLSDNVESCAKIQIPEVQNYELELKSVTRYNDLKAEPKKAVRTMGPTVDINTSQNNVPHNDVGGGSNGSFSSSIMDVGSSNGSTNYTSADKVNQMFEISGLSKDECYFYLESMSWNLEKAVEMWEGLNKSSPR